MKNPFVLLMCCSLIACAAAPSTNKEAMLPPPNPLLPVPADPFPQHADPPDFVAYFFKPGEPRELGGDLLSSLERTSPSLPALREDVNLVEHFPEEVALRVVGYADDGECTGDACWELSWRRASALHAWLVAHGAPAGRLGPPCGYGTSQPLEAVQTEAGRILDRRAYVSYGNSGMSDCLLEEAPHIGIAGDNEAAARSEPTCRCLAR